MDDFAAWSFGEWPNVAIFWVALPLVFGFYPWVVRMSGSIYEQLRDDGALVNQALGIKNGCVGSAVESIKDMTCHRYWSYVALIVAVIAQTILFTAGFGTEWEKIPGIGRDIWLSVAIATPLNILAWYVITMMVGRYIATVIGLSKFFSSGLVMIRPWHPDRCGGLGTISNYALRMTWFIAACGVTVLLFAYVSFILLLEGDAGLIVRDPWIWFNVLLYVVLAPSVFFMTLGAAHNAMRNAKRDQLQLVSDRLDAEFQEVREKIAVPDGDFPGSVTRIKGLSELYEITRSFPIWPFDLLTIRRFGAAVFAPFVTVGASIGIQELVRSA